MKTQTMKEFPTGGGGSFNCLRQDSTPERVWKWHFRQLFFYYSKFVKAFFFNNVFWGLSLSRYLFVCHRRVAKALAFPPQKKVAFTLAEVLITLGIIGIVAAMTMPALIQKHRRSVTETALKKFYSTMNQAVNLSVAENGETKYWTFGGDNSNESIEDFYKRYLKKYLKILKTEIITVKLKQQSEVERFSLYFSDGSAAAIDWKGHDWFYCIKAKDLSRYIDKKGTGCFMFGFYPTGDNINSTFTFNNYYNKGVEPFVLGSKIEVGKDEEGNPIMEYPTEETVYQGKFYAKAIQLNGWKIPKDYPLKF